MIKFKQLRIKTRTHQISKGDSRWFIESRGSVPKVRASANFLGLQRLLSTILAILWTMIEDL